MHFSKLILSGLMAAGFVAAAPIVDERQVAPTNSFSLLPHPTGTFVFPSGSARPTVSRPPRPTGTGVRPTGTRTRPSHTGSYTGSHTRPTGSPTGTRAPRPTTTAVAEEEDTDEQ